MSIRELEKNFGGARSSPVPQEPVQVVAVQTPVEIYTPRTSFESVSLLTRESCNGGHFWRWKTNWFCARCRVPPDAKFIEEEFGGTGVLTREDERRGIDQQRSSKLLEIQKLSPDISTVVSEGDSVFVVEGDNACAECPCRWVKETPHSDGTVKRWCYSCNAAIPYGRHGVVRFKGLPSYLLPFLKWFNENKQEA